jgi:hypothetical protein
MLNAVEKLPLSGDWIAMVFLCLLSLLVVVKVLYPNRLKSLLSCFFSKNYFLDYPHDRQEILGSFHTVMFLVQNIILGLFLYLFSMQTGFFLQEKGLHTYLSFVLFATLCIWIQYAISRGVSLFFRFERIFEIGHYVKSTYLKAAALFYLPVLLCWIYACPNNQAMFYFALFLGAGFWLARWILILLFNIQAIKVKWFYFILYICTLEIVPFVLLVKWTV